MSKATILMYHNIANPPAGAKMRGLYVTPRMFHFQMWYLKFAGFTVVGLDEVENYAKGRQNSSKIVALTFDDGFADFYKNAFPVLQKYGYPSTVYLVSERIGQINQWDYSELNVEKPLMNWSMIRELQNQGVAFGSHTQSHCFLANVPADQMHQEIVGSKKRLEQELQTEVAHFCYPYGNYNEESRNCVAEAGYRTATTTQRGYVKPGDDCMTLKRAFVKYRTYPLAFMRLLHTDYETGR